MSKSFCTICGNMQDNDGSCECQPSKEDCQMCRRNEDLDFCECLVDFYVTELLKVKNNLTDTKKAVLISYNFKTDKVHRTTFCAETDYGVIDPVQSACDLRDSIRDEEGMENFHWAVFSDDDSPGEMR